MKAYTRDRLAETPDRREARLDRQRVTVRERLASDTAEEREDMLGRMRAGQSERLASETADERPG